MEQWRWYYLYFASPIDNKTLGSCIVCATNAAEAVQESIIAGCNGGGQVAIGLLPHMSTWSKSVRNLPIYTLISPELIKDVEE